VEDVTGPPMLLQSVKAYNATIGLAHVKILEPGIIYPIDWRYTSQDWKNAGVLIVAFAMSYGAYSTHCRRLHHGDCSSIGVVQLALHGRLTVKFDVAILSRRAC